MKIRIIVVAISAIYLSGCASNHVSSRLDSVETLSAANANANNVGKRMLVQGQGVSVWGDWQTSTLLFAKAVEANPTPLNKFNLATAYERTGRNGQALITYDAVVKEGAGARGRALAQVNGSDERLRSYDLAAESKLRVAALLEKIRVTPTAATGDEEETPLTPQQAAALDARENPL